METEKSDEFNKWFGNLKDYKAVARIDIRIGRIEQGNLGDVKPARDGISELRDDYGPGYRVYCKPIGNILVLLYGGTKATQDRDINRAIRIAANYKLKGK